MRLTFPKGFLWGSATSAHQVEGNNLNSDWWRWENSPKRLESLKKQNKNPEDYISGIGCDSYHRYEEDFDLAKELGHNTHRLSIEWARIEPEQGNFSASEIEHYRKVLQAVKVHGMKTFLTLHHFTNPVWFLEMGGWTKTENIKYFLRYAQFVLQAIADLVDFICVVNEPNVYARFSYLKGAWPPEVRNYFAHKAVLKNMIAAHKQVYAHAKSKNFSAPVGSTVTMNPVYGFGPLNILFENWLYLNLTAALASQSDFIGVQYYKRILGFGTSGPLTDFDWEIYPAGLMKVLKQCTRLGKPIYITENGIADAKDAKRTDFIKEHLRFVHQAIIEGVDVRGYLHWSLLDNFEWAEGWRMKFGLIEVQRKNNLQRKIRPSAQYYQQICKNNYL
jgi:beta-glucosidase